MTIRTLAAAVLALEALGLAVILAWEVVALVSGDIVSLSSSLALVVLTAIGVAAIAAFAVATARGRSAGRSGGIVVQALILAVAIGTLTGDTANPALAAAIAAPALIGGVLLFLAAREAGPRGRGDAEA